MRLVTRPFHSCACPPADEVKGPVPPKDGGTGPFTRTPAFAGAPGGRGQDGVMTTLRAEFSAALENTSYASPIWAKVNE